MTSTKQRSAPRGAGALSEAWERRTLLVKHEAAAASAVTDAKTARLKLLRLEKKRGMLRSQLRRRRIPSALGPSALRLNGAKRPPRCCSVFRKLPHMTSSRYHITLLTCSHCNARGVATWELAHDGLQMQLVKVAGDFHVESGRTAPDTTMIICDKCDQIHGEAVITR
jgi:hypothetical protein